MDIKRWRTAFIFISIFLSSYAYPGAFEEQYSCGPSEDDATPVLALKAKHTTDLGSGYFLPKGTYYVFPGNGSMSCYSGSTLTHRSNIDTSGSTGQGFYRYNLGGWKYGSNYRVYDVNMNEILYGDNPTNYSSSEQSLVNAKVKILNHAGGNILLESRLGWSSSNAEFNIFFVRASDVNDPDIDLIAYDDDNCPYVHNSDQVDSNNNGIGDVCDNVAVDFLTSAVKNLVIDE